MFQTRYAVVGIVCVVNVGIVCVRLESRDVRNTAFAWQTANSLPVSAFQNARRCPPKSCSDYLHLLQEFSFELMSTLTGIRVIGAELEL